MDEERHPALEATMQGSSSLDVVDHLENFLAVEPATLFFGEQYVDIDRLIGAFRIEYGTD